MTLLLQRLLGETWCYATIVLIGQENCPHHHRHANELDRISKANEHIQYYDCHGRLCERLVVYDVLQRVYAENAPTRDDIMNPAYVFPLGVVQSVMITPSHYRLSATISPRPLTSINKWILTYLSLAYWYIHMYV